MDRRGRIVRTIWAACLVLAGLNHARILLQYGLWWDYDGVPQASAVYWSSLTLVDPLVAVLLFTRPRIGVPATVVVIATNVVHNLALTAHYVPAGAFVQYIAGSRPMVGQIGFLLFVIATLRTARSDLPATKEPG